MLEKDILLAVEPLVDELVSLRKQFEAIPVPKDGADADPAQVAEVLKADGSFVSLLRGEKGLPGDHGKDGHRGVDGADGAPGAPGADADPVQVAKALKADDEFLTVVRGEKGLPGKPGEPGEPGRPGIDADPVAVAAVLKSDEQFRAGLRGVNGVGIKAIGVVPDSGIMTVTLDDDSEIDVELPRGLKGDPGEPGSDGLGIEVKQWQPGVYRQGVFAMADLGRVYKAVRDTASTPGSQDWERVGSFGFAWKGLRQADSVFEDGDLYIDGGSTFVWLGGKGHMFCQKGARGAQGEPGKDGSDGTDAPYLVHGRMTVKSLELAMSDGSILEAQIDGLQKAVADQSQAVLLNAWEEHNQAIRDEGGTPLRSFRGVYQQGGSYSEGDVVTFNKTLWVATQTIGSRWNDDEWKAIFAAPGGGTTPHSNSVVPRSVPEFDSAIVTPTGAYALIPLPAGYSSGKMVVAFSGDIDSIDLQIRTKGAAANAPLQQVFGGDDAGEKPDEFGLLVIHDSATIPGGGALQFMLTMEWEYMTFENTGRLSVRILGYHPISGKSVLRTAALYVVPTGAVPPSEFWVGLNGNATLHSAKRTGT